METSTFRSAIVIAAAAIALSGCSTVRQSQPADARPIGKPVEIAVPLGLPPLPPSPDNPPTAETIALGRKLFYDTRLSSDNTISCASCHNPMLGFSDGRRVSVGVQGHSGSRNAQTVINAVYNPVQFWDGRANSLEDQAAGPIANPTEMNQTHDACSTQLDKDPSYKVYFDRAFGPGPVTIDKIQKAIAAFERTVLAANSPVDRFLYGGDKTALSESAKRGLMLFVDKEKTNCTACHTMGDKNALFTDGKFHNIGVGLGTDGELLDKGKENGMFRTPTLRNIAKTAPYMHDGSLKTLRDVVDFYAGGGNSNPWLDKEIRPLGLSRQERDDLVAFMEALTGEVPAETGPPPLAR
jgi:cytochrome c peroxidase